MFSLRGLELVPARSHKAYDAGSNPAAATNSRNNLRGGAEVAYQVHTLEITGANPVPATIYRDIVQSG